jgi:hypothetical protein
MCISNCATGLSRGFLMFCFFVTGCGVEAMVDCWIWKFENVIRTSILLNYLENFKTCGESTLDIKHVSFLHTAFVWNIFGSNKNLVRCAETRICHRVKLPWNLSSLNKTEMLWQFFIIFLKAKCHENPSSSSWDFLCVCADRWTDWT